MSSRPLDTLQRLRTKRKFSVCAGNDCGIIAIAKLHDLYFFSSRETDHKGICLWASRVEVCNLAIVVDALLILASTAFGQA